jgi:TrmH family RNA methyltransferase
LKKNNLPDPYWAGAVEYQTFDLRDRILVNVRIILVGTTHPGNIGATARAMKNMGLSDLMLVSPRYFPHDDATARAAGAEDILQESKVVASLEEALSDCTYAAGASARSRSIGWPSMAPRDCAARLVQESAHGVAAVVFGPEKSGLTNEDLDRCNTLLTIPTEPGFSSLNLAMAVQVLVYELRMAGIATDETLPEPESPPATGTELENLYTHLEQVLTRSGFLDPENPRLLMRRLRRLFVKAELDQNEVNILRGMLAALDPEEPKDQVE